MAKYSVHQQPVETLLSWIKSGDNKSCRLVGTTSKRKLLEDDTLEELKTYFKFIYQSLMQL